MSNSLLKGMGSIVEGMLSFSILSRDSNKFSLKVRGRLEDLKADEEALRSDTEALYVLRKESPIL